MAKTLACNSTGAFERSRSRASASVRDSSAKTDHRATERHRDQTCGAIDLELETELGWVNMSFSFQLRAEGLLTDEGTIDLQGQRERTRPIPARFNGREP